jgi:F-type H+-transporting ATPase subunit b
MLTSAAAFAAAAGAAGAAAAKGGLPQLHVPDFAPQLIWLAITFGALYFLMSRVALPRIGEVIEERRQRIQRDLDEAERLKSETEKAIANYEQALADARAKAGGIAKETRATLASEVDAERATVEQEIAAKLADAEARIAKTKSNALSQVNDIAADTASAIVERLLGQKVSVDDVRTALTPAPAE